MRVSIWFVGFSALLLFTAGCPAHERETVVDDIRNAIVGATDEAKVALAPALDKGREAALIVKAYVENFMEVAKIVGTHDRCEDLAAALDAHIRKNRARAGWPDGPPPGVKAQPREWYMGRVDKQYRDRIDAGIEKAKRECPAKSGEIAAKITEALDMSGYRP